MNSFDDWKKVVRRNKKIGQNGPGRRGIFERPRCGHARSRASDVLSKIRKDFDATGVVQSDEQIIQVMDDLMLQAGNLMPTGGGGPDSDALALMLARQLKPE
jgi:hypothetical protein